MKPVFLKVLLVISSLLLSGILKAQIPLYMNSSGNFSSYKGGPLTFETDEDEESSMEFAIERPIDFEINDELNPTEISLGTAQGQMYSGKVYPSFAYWKDGDSVAPASIDFNYQFTYWTPDELFPTDDQIEFYRQEYGVSSIDLTANNFTCKSCPFHGKKGGKHEEVHVISQDLTLDFKVYILKIKILGETEVREGDTVQYTAQVYLLGVSYCYPYCQQLLVRR